MKQQNQASQKSSVDDIHRWSFGDLHSSYLAWAILFFSAVISVAAWYFSHSSVIHSAETRFKFKSDDIQASIQRRMKAQEAALWSGVGFFKGSNDVSRAEWADFVETLHLEKYLPGLQGFGYAEFVRPEERSAYVARIRSEGFKYFDIRPEGKREVYTSIIFLEPFSDRNLRAFGYDMFSEPTRRAAMQRAIDTGKAAVSGMVTLVQETGKDVQRGFLMYLPLYKKGMPTETVAQRRAAVQGFVYSPFRINDLMRGILGREDKEIAFRIYDGTAIAAENKLYDSAEGEGEFKYSGYNQFTGERGLEIGGHDWKIEFLSRSNFISVSEQNQPFIIAAGAILIDLLLFLTISSLSHQRKRAVAIAGRMTSELLVAKERAEKAAENELLLRTATQETNSKLQQANDGLLKFSSIVAHDLRAPLKRIECFIDILQQEYRDSVDEEGQDILARIDRGSARMRMMLDSLHSYAKYSGCTITGKTTGITHIVNGAIETLSDQVGDAKITTQIDDSFLVKGDQMLLEHVIQNLVSNSIKFCDEAVPEILIEGRLLSADMAEISVSDNGIGIETEFAAKVFDMFERLHDEDEYEGTGIGLSICRQIVSDHGGEISVDTHFAGGCRIVFSLPVDQSKAMSSSTDDAQDRVNEIAKDVVQAA